MTDSVVFRDSVTGDFRDATGTITVGGAFTGDAGDVPFTPAGTIAATDVQAAIVEVAAEAQPVDSDLTAIAALTTTSFGRALLEMANQAALLAAAGAAAAVHVHSGADITSGTVADARIDSAIARDSEVTSAISALSSVYQPLDSDLTAVAALTTTSYGRAFLELADAAAGRTALGLGTLATQSGTFSGTSSGTNTGDETAAAFGGARWTVVTKTGDESVASSTVVQNDDELFFATVSGAVYEVDLFLIFGSPAGAGTPDIKTDLGEDGTTRGYFLGYAISTADAATSLFGVANQTVTWSWGTAATDRVARYIGWYIGGGGTFRLRWSQFTSGVNATIVRSGSALRYRRIV